MNLIYYYSLGRYTWETTLINVIIGLLLFYLAYWLVMKRYLSLKDVFLGSICWGILGLSIRFSADILNLSMPYRLFFITPFIYVETYFVALSMYLLVKNRRYMAVWYYFPFLSGISFIMMLSFYAEHFRWVYAMIILILTFILYFFSKKRYNNMFLFLPIIFQIYDALTTFFALTFLHFREEHVLGNMIITFAEKYLFTINGSGSWLFLLVKAFIVIIIIEYFYRIKVYNREDVKIALMFIALLGAFTGTRNLLNILFV